MFQGLGSDSGTTWAGARGEMWGCGQSLQGRVCRGDHTSALASLSFPHSTPRPTASSIPSPGVGQPWCPPAWVMNVGGGFKQLSRGWGGRGGAGAWVCACGH